MPISECDYVDELEGGFKCPVPTADELGAAHSHVVKGGTGYDKSSWAGATAVMQAIRPVATHLFNAQQMDSRSSGHGFREGGQQHPHGDVRHWTVISAYSKKGAKLVWFWKKQEVLYWHRAEHRAQPLEH